MQLLITGATGFEMSEQERDTMGSNGLAVSAREFDRDTLIDRLEGWIGQLQGDATSLSASRLPS
jgi:hypothetical protein